MFVHDLGTVLDSVCNQLAQVLNFARLRKRCEGSTTVPGHSRFHFADRFIESCDKLIEDTLVNKNYFQCRTPLTIEGKASSDALTNGIIQISIGQYNSRV